MTFRVILVALLTGILLAFLSTTGLFSGWNHSLTDLLYGGQQPLDDIVLVAVDDYSLQQLGTWPWNRTAYVPLLDAARNARVIGFDLGFFEPTPNDAPFRDALSDADAVLAAKYDADRNATLEPVFPATQGVVNIYTDKDGVSRRVPVNLHGQTGFAAAVVEAYLGQVPTLPDVITVNYVGGPGSYKTYPAADVIQGKVEPPAFEGAIVLVGATAPDFHDEYLVPTSDGRRMPGVEIHAHAVQTILTKSVLTPMSTGALVFVILLFAVIIGLLYSRFGMVYTLTAAAALLFVYLMVAVYQFKNGHVLNLVWPPLTIIVTTITTAAYTAAAERKMRQYVHNVLGKYVSSSVADYLLQHKEAITLGGKEQDITAMFADIRGFTAMSEKMTPQQVIHVLNHYFGDMTDLVFKHEGTLDKFIGDCLFAVWGSPLPDEEHALHAVQCALAMQQKLKEKHRKDIPPITLGIGMCSGSAVVGNMGSPQRQEYTAIGDTVNTASRLAGLSKGNVIISQFTYDLVKDKVKVKKLEPVSVKGKEKPLQIYEAVGLK